jgi:hypothetical protein
MYQMQQEFDADFPELGIHIVGINEHGQAFGNSNITEEMPWLQDFDTNGDTLGEVWELWDVEWRDLTILDRDNVPVITYNLTNFDLAIPANFDTVRQAFLSIATSGDVPDGEGEATDAAALSNGQTTPSNLDLLDETLAAESDWLSRGLDSQDTAMLSSRKSSFAAVL